MKIIHKEFLPVTQKSCHAASIAFYNDHPVFSWFEGSREGAPDVYIKIYNQNGNKDESFIGDKDDLPRWNPILFTIDNKLFLFEKIGHFCDRWNTIMHDLSSSNGDKKKIYVLPAGINASVKTKPIIIGDKMYCGSSVETIVNWSSYIEEFSILNEAKLPKYFMNTVKRSAPLCADMVEFKDGYGTLHISKGLIQPSIWYDGENLNAFFRSSYGLGKIFYSMTEGTDTDKWIKPVPTIFNNPNSSIDTVFTNNRLFLIHNPSSTLRKPLELLELDNRHKIVSNLIIENEVEISKDIISLELSYPYMIEHNGQLHIVFTYGRSKIEYVVVEI